MRKLDEQRKTYVKNRVIELTPTTIENPNIEGLKKICEEYVTECVENGWADDDLTHYIFEEALMACIGRRVFDQIREIEKIKKEK